jgi:voltage-gated potassium channel
MRVSSSSVEVRYGEVAVRQRRTLAFLAVARACASTALIVALYYLLPFDRRPDGIAVVELVLGLVVIAGVIFWQFRAIVRSRHPAARAFEAVAVIAPLFLIMFASTYFLMEEASSGNFSQRLTRTDSLYFTVTTFATVGFGDITARSQTARVVVTIQMLADLAVLGLGVRAILLAVRRGQERVSEGDPGSGPA